MILVIQGHGLAKQLDIKFDKINYYKKNIFVINELSICNNDKKIQ